MLGFALDRKEAFLDYKNINSKVEILLFFFKGVSPWLFFGQIKPEEIVFDVFDRKECFLNQKSKVFKKAKKSKFFKGVSLKKVRKIKIFQRG